MRPPAPTRKAITRPELQELYVERGLTIAQVAARYGVAPTTISRRLEDLNIHARRSGPRSAGQAASGPLPWTADRAYAVGLIATDGNLSRKAGRLTITSNDVDLLSTVRRRLDLCAPIRPHRGGYGYRCHRLAWSDIRFYNWLLDLGLTPAKSLTLGPLAIPDNYFADFLRGCIDGDGSVLVYTDRYHSDKNARYVYERLYVSLVSASPAFVSWIQASAHHLLGVRGAISRTSGGERRAIWKVRYAKEESICLLRAIYYAPDVCCLWRKRAVAERFLRPLGYASVRPSGRPRVGWLYNERSENS
jgi:hypothetical protein